MQAVDVPLVETHAIPDTFISGIARVDLVGRDFYRITFYADGNCTHDGRPERVVVARFVLADRTITQCIETVVKARAKPVFPANN